MTRRASKPTTTTVIYAGPQPAVIIAETGQRAAIGDPVEVPADLAERLTRQPSWLTADQQPATDPEPVADGDS